MLNGNHNIKTFRITGSRGGPPVAEMVDAIPLSPPDAPRQAGHLVFFCRVKTECEASHHAIREYLQKTQMQSLWGKVERIVGSLGTA